MEVKIKILLYSFIILVVLPLAYPFLEVDIAVGSSNNTFISNTTILNQTIETNDTYNYVFNDSDWVGMRGTSQGVLQLEITGVVAKPITSPNDTYLFAMNESSGLPIPMLADSKGQLQLSIASMFSDLWQRVTNYITPKNLGDNLLLHGWINATSINATNFYGSDFYDDGEQVCTASNALCNQSQATGTMFLRNGTDASLKSVNLTNLTATNNIDAFGNISATQFIGDGSLLHGLIGGAFELFLHGDDEDFGKSLRTNVTDSVNELVFNFTITEDNQYLINFTTVRDFPSIGFIPTGGVQFHFHALKKGFGGKDVSLWANLTRMTSQQNETIGVTVLEHSSLLTTDDLEYNTHGAIPSAGVIMNLTDRFQLRVYAHLQGAGGNPDIELHIEGPTGSRVALPAQAVTINNFVPYIGATQNINTGIRDIMTNRLIVGSNKVNISSTGDVNATKFYGDGGSLTGIGGTHLTNGTDATFTGLNSTGGLEVTGTAYIGGKVGIGTTSPSSNVHILGAASPLTQLLIERDSDSTGGALVNLFHNTASPANTDAAGIIRFMESRTGVQATQIEYGRIAVNPTDVTDTAEGGKMEFWTANAGTSAVKMTILNDGNVGIGTATPTYKLQIEKETSLGKDLNVSDILFVNSSSGNVGIGTLTPGAALEVNGNIRIKNVGLIGPVGDPALAQFSNGELEINGDQRIDGQLGIGTNAHATARIHTIGGQAWRMENAALDGFTLSQFGVKLWGWAQLSSGHTMRVNSNFEVGQAGAFTFTVMGDEIRDSAKKAWITSDGSQNTTLAGDLYVTSNVGIGTFTPSFPLTVMGNATDGSNAISIWAEANMSARGYITRTSVFDKSQNALSFIQDSDYYKDNGKINHSRFYGYVSYNTTDLDRPVIIKGNYTYFNETANSTIIKFYNKTTYPFTKIEEGVELGREIDVIRQGLYEIKSNPTVENTYDDTELRELIANLTVRVNYLESLLNVTEEPELTPLYECSYRGDEECPGGLSEANKDTGLQTRCYNPFKLGWKTCTTGWTLM